MPLVSSTIEKIRGRYKHRATLIFLIVLLCNGLILSLRIGKNEFARSALVSALIGRSDVSPANNLAAANVPTASTLWQQTGYLTAPDVGPDDEMGNAVSVSGNTAIVGAQFHTVNGKHLLGAAYIFLRSSTN